jgi:hypothetical protein
MGEARPVDQQDEGQPAEQPDPGLGGPAQGHPDKPGVDGGLDQHQVAVILADDPEDQGPGEQIDDAEQAADEAGGDQVQPETEGYEDVNVQIMVANPGAAGPRRPAGEAPVEEVPGPADQQDKGGGGQAGGAQADSQPNEAQSEQAAQKGERICQQLPIQHSAPSPKVSITCQVLSVKCGNVRTVVDP